MYINVIIFKSLIFTLFSWETQINYWSLESYSWFWILLNLFQKISIGEKEAGQKERRNEAESVSNCLKSHHTVYDMIIIIMILVSDGITIITVLKISQLYNEVNCINI